LPDSSSATMFPHQRIHTKQLRTVGRCVFYAVRVVSNTLCVEKGELVSLE
jgi:hypothetical protein